MAYSFLTTRPIISNAMSITAGPRPGIVLSESKIFSIALYDMKKVSI